MAMSFTSANEVQKEEGNRIKLESRLQNSEPSLKVWILGAPGSGKTVIAKQISEMYQLLHFTKEVLIKSTVEMLRQTAATLEGEAEIEGTEGENDRDKQRDLAAQLLLELDLGQQNEETDEEAEIESDSQLGDELLCKLVRYRLLSNHCQNQGFVLDGFPETHKQAKLLLLAQDTYDGEEPGEDEYEGLERRLVPDNIFVLEAPDEFLTQRLLAAQTSELEERHEEKSYPALLEEYRKKMENYGSTVQHYLDLQEITYAAIDVSGDSVATLDQICEALGKPKNSGLNKDDDSTNNGGQSGAGDSAEKDMKLRELEEKELEERRKNIQNWMEKFAKIKSEEFDQEEAALIPLRHYLMAHVVPTLTNGLLEISKIRPDDPVDYLAEFLFQHNPGSINDPNAARLRESPDTKK